jgi:hypothetical protein
VGLNGEKEKGEGEKVKGKHGEGDGGERRGIELFNEVCFGILFIGR